MLVVTDTKQGISRKPLEVTIRILVNTWTDPVYFFLVRER